MASQYTVLQPSGAVNSIGDIEVRRMTRSTVRCRTRPGALLAAWWMRRGGAQPDNVRVYRVSDSAWSKLIENSHEN
jgi:hypothetical protein